MNLNDAAGMALAFVLIVVVGSVGGQVLAGVQSSQISTAVEFLIGRRWFEVSNGALLIGPGAAW